MQSFRMTDEEFQQMRGRDELEELRAELHTRPRVLYRNLRRATCLFLGGTVTRSLADGGTDNVAEARVELTLGEAAPASCLTDNFGDFKFDGLGAAGAAWSLRVSHPQYGCAAAAGKLSESRYIGLLLLA